MRLHDQTSTERGIPERRPRRVQSTGPVARLSDSTMEESRREGSGCMTAVGWSLLAGLLGGCAPDEELPLPPVVWEGKSVRVRMDDPGIEVCGGSFEALDRHAELVREALLLEGDGVVEYSIGDQDFVDERCNLDMPAPCTQVTTGDVFTSIPMLEHEIVHAVRVLDPELALLSSSFEEGLATMFGGDRFDDDGPPLDSSILLSERQLEGALEYYHAGQTMALLLERHGRDAFRSFNTLASTMGEDDAFLAAFGESKEQFVTATEDAAYCEQSQWWTPLLECDGEPATADPMTGALVLSGSLDCRSPDVYGPRSERMWTSRHFRLDETTNNLSYEFDIPEDAVLEIVACGGGCPSRFAYIGARDQLGSILHGVPALEPGEYFLRLSRPISGDDGFFQVVMHR